MAWLFYNGIYVRGAGGAASQPRRTSTGLIYKTDFDDISGWTNDGTFSNVASDALIAFDYFPIDFRRSINGSDHTGVRNPLVLKDGSNLILEYSGSDSTQELFIDQWASSANGGVTWAKKGFLIPAVDGDGTAIVMHTSGYLMKDGGYYYCYRLISYTNYNDPDYGNWVTVPYFSDLWRATALDGTWEFVCDLPDFPGTWADRSTVPGTIIKVGSTYYYFINGYADANYRPAVGYATASSLSGPFTLENTTILTTTMLGDSRYPENPKIFYHPILGKFINLSATLYSTTNDRTIVQISSSVSDWSLSVIRYLQASSIMDSNGVNQVDFPCPVYKPDYSILIGNNDFIPIAYDRSGDFKTPGFHFHRIMAFTELEPSRNTLRFDGSVSGAIRKAQVNSDFVAEFGVQFDSYTASELVGFIFRSDGTGNNEYVLQVQNGGAKLKLIKRVSGSPTTIETGTASQTVIASMINRIKVIANGTSIKAYINGQLQIDSTDSAFSTGTYIGFSGASGANTDIRLLSLRSSNDVTLNGLPEGTEVVIMGDGGIAAATALANSSGVATLTLNHYPFDSFCIDGRNYVISGGIWGGDTFDCSKLSITTPVENTIVSATVEDDALSNVVVTFTNDIYDDILPETTVFSISGKTISAVTVSGNVVTISVSAEFEYGDSISLVYTRPFGNALRSVNGNYIDSFTQSVTNNITDIRILYDTFTDTDGVHLHDHTMEIGAGWTAPVGLTISNNAVKSAAAGVATIYSGVAEGGIADVDITSTIWYPNTTYYLAGVTFRYTNDTTKLYCFVQRDNVGVMNFCLKRDNNTNIQTVAVTHVAGNRVIRVVANGQSVKCYLDGNLLIDQTVTQHTTITKHGVITYRDTNYNNDTYILDFVANRIV